MDGGWRSYGDRKSTAGDAGPLQAVDGPAGVRWTSRSDNVPKAAEHNARKVEQVERCVRVPASRIQFNRQKDNFFDFFHCFFL